MIAKFLNANCACKTFDPELLKTKLESDELLKGLYGQIIEGKPNLFSATTVFISPDQLDAMTSIINAIEETILNPKYRNLALSRSPSIPQIDYGPKGVFMGYDFHLSDDGPKLIEINTNAGGALLNLELAKAQQECCQESNVFFKHRDELLSMDKIFYEMFIREWELQRGNTKIGLIAIVDDNPKEQYLYPEFQLFERLFAKFGAKAIIADPKDLHFRDGNLWYGKDKVDLIYNRLTDFYLEDDTQASIRSAYEQNSIVLTPSPHHHAIYANKLNLVALSSDSRINDILISDKTKQTLLAGIPKTEDVSVGNSDDLWERRRGLFFKPASGYGSKATYRGDKITRKVWEEILKGQYVAQALIPPSKRLIQKDGEQTDLKVDIRAYVYNGKIQLLAARLYSGQTTNFRTSGGGFAPVFVIKEESSIS
jgi:hypothetical protein